MDRRKGEAGTGMDDNDQEAAGRVVVAAAFGGSVHPLGKHEASFTSLAVDPFERYLTEWLVGRDLPADT